MIIYTVQGQKLEEMGKKQLSLADKARKHKVWNAWLN